MVYFQDDEIARYSRHIVLPEVGGRGQQLLKHSSALVVGAGGLGAPVLVYLAAAGLGRLGVVDDDEVELSNLQRQIIHGTPDVGRLKVDSATDMLGRLNPWVAVEPHPFRLTQHNVDTLVAGYDVIVDGSDNIDTRYRLADACERQERPLVVAALSRFDGSLTTLMPYAKNADGAPNPRLRDLFPAAAPAGSIPNCVEGGVIGTAAGILGTLQAMEVLRVLLGLGSPLVGTLLLVDTLAFRFDKIRYSRA
jgi:molybdopterin/thiamine biosynthesis adenylyltransferase